MPASPARTIAAILIAAGCVCACSDGTGPGRDTRTPLKFIDIATAYVSSCAVSSDSTLYCWGGNAGDALGTPTSSTCDLLGGGSQPCSTRPLKVAGAPKLTGLNGGYNYFCGLDPVGAAYCWGSITIYVDLSESLGQTPTALPGGLALTQLATGWNHICGLTGSAIACWGAYDSGVRGDPNVDLNTYPPPTFTPNLVGGGLSFRSVVAGHSNSCALTTAGLAYCWGPALDGQLGDPAAATQTACGGTLSPCAPLPVPVAGGYSFTSLSGGEAHYCGTTAAAESFCWGAGGDGQLYSIPSYLSLCFYNGSSRPCAPSPMQIGPSSASVGDYVSVVAGARATCGLDGSGNAECAGSNDYGQLGNGGGPGPSVVLLPGGRHVRVIAPGLYHTCALATDSLAYCWGDNDLGELGTGDTRDSNLPVAVVGPESP